MNKDYSNSIKDDALSESAQSILNARPSYVVRYGGPLILLVLIVCTILLAINTYVPVSEANIESVKRKSLADTSVVVFKTSSLKIFQVGERVKIVPKKIEEDPFYGIVDSVHSDRSIQQLFILISSSNIDLHSSEFEDGDFLITQKGEVLMKLILNRKMHEER
ncbi:hypothetical protein QT327_04595 [Olivibacter sp. 47]|uniref:hypothetical protein n=1 Tax=Olivibacter sp. 47 TaxID=3056486 RepID=UPI0025A37E2E|nr:hypothetical protein [Olivibacter sp. 47]MDM8173645.1 hypothetical protein [Olivibacter sp. 47]